MPVSQAAVDHLRRDVDRLTQPLRVVLIGFSMLKDLYLSLKEQHKLTDFPKEAIPVLLATLKAQIPAEKWCAPQLSPAAARVRSEMQVSLESALGREGAESISCDCGRNPSPRSPAGRMPYP